MNIEKFNELYKNLNPAQKQAVDAIDGPVMVIAGPGTGKTSILTLRIANILRKTDTPPGAILALTFTESGAYNMRKKLVEIIGSAGYKVNIATFHGFCNNIIKEYPERFPRIVGSIAMSDIDQIKVVVKIILDGDFILLKPWGEPLHYVKPTLNVIKNLKRDNYGSEDLEKSIKLEEKLLMETPDLYHEKGAHKGKMKGEYIKQKERIAKNKELLQIFTAYEKTLFERKLYDYEDMIIEVVKALRADSDFLLILQESYQYILADEHQDANRAQNIILELLSSFHENPNFFIVGDEKQAIFRFQGASLENFLYFKKLYSKALMVNLEDNYRSHQGILDASHSIILKNVAPENFARVRLKAKSELPPNLIGIYGFKTEDLEHFFIASDIKKKLAQGIEPSDIAILYRENKDAHSIASSLSRVGISFQIESDEDLLSDTEIRKLILIFRSISDLGNDTALGEVLFIDFFGIPVISVFKAMKESHTKRVPLHELVKTDFPEVWKKLVHFALLSKNKPFIEVFETVVRESGFLSDTLKSSDSLSRILKLETFFGEIKKLSSGVKTYFLSDFSDYLALAENHGILFKYSGRKETMGGVRLMTAHKSKGLEFHHIYIVGAYDGHWGNKKSKKSFHLSLLEGDNEDGGGKIEDERRLFYVALTRAKESVSISYSLESSDGRERLPSQFIEEIDPNVRETIKTDEVEKSYAETPAFNFKEKVSPIASISDSAYIKSIFLEQGLNVSALNNYLACPWKYFFVSLIRLPESLSKHQIYGTAVHETLRTFFNKYREENDMNRKELLDLFEHNLAKQPLSSSDFKEIKLKGRKSLGGYYDTYKNTWSRNLVNEFKISGVVLPIKIGSQSVDIVLNGRLDKIELQSDEKTNIVDYKTGKAKSKNEIMGKTKDATGDYYRQLVFYKLLLSMDSSSKYKMQSGELDFTEPDEKMRYKKERFEITDGEVEELKKLIAKVATEILNLEFWDKTCGEKDCEYCVLRELLS